MCIPLSRYSKFLAHRARIRSISISDDCKFFLSASDDHLIKLWRFTSLADVCTFAGHTDWVRDTIFAPNPQFIFSASDDGSVAVWNINNGNPVLTFRKHIGRVICLTTHSDNIHVFSGAYDRKIHMWNFLTGEITTSFIGDKGWITRLVLISDQKILFSSSDGSLSVWDITNQSVVRKSGHTGKRRGIYSLALNLKKTFAASGTVSGEVKIWEISSLAEVSCTSGHDAPITGLAFTNEDLLLTVSEDGYLKVWSIPHLELLFSKNLKNSLSSLAVMHNTREVLVGDYCGNIDIYHMH